MKNKNKKTFIIDGVIPKGIKIDVTCTRCGKKMTPVYDSLAKKYTFNLWRCDKCTPDGIVLALG